MHTDNKKLKRLSVRFLFFVVCLMFLLCLSALPFVISSAFTDLMSPPSDQVVAFTPEVPPKDDYSRLHIHVVGLDEVNSLAKLKLHGFRSCTTDCKAYEENVLFFDADKQNDHLKEAVPSHKKIQMPSNSDEFTQEFTVPMRGQLFFYPFDSYNVAIGVALQRVYPDGRKVVLSPAETAGHLVVTLEDDVPRADLTQVNVIDPRTVKPKKLSFEYAYARQLRFERPVYSIITVMLVIILSIAVTIFTMITRSFDQLVINTSALIFGVWGLRSLLLTGYPSDATLLDTVLQGLVVFILMAVAFRSMNFFHRAGAMRIFPWAREPLTKDCPECLTEIKYHAKRCPSCSAPVGS